MMSHRYTWVSLLIVSCLVSLSVVRAQLDCPTLVEQALNQMAVNCNNLADNTICYGHPTVESVTQDGASLLQTIGDRIPISALQSLRTSSADPGLGSLGVALGRFVNPDSTNLTILMLGGATLEPLESLQSAAFQFRTDFSPGSCAEASSLVALQSPRDSLVTISFNGINAQVGGLVVLQWRSNNGLTAAVGEGQLVIQDGPSAQAGQTLSGVMDNDGQVQFWSAPRPSDAGEIQNASVALSAFSRLGMSPVQIISTATPEPPPAVLPAPSCATVVHVVSQGENLFRIGLRYGVTVDAIVDANRLPSREQISVGQQLIIPCGADSGLSSQALGSAGENGSASNGQPSSPTAFDCSVFLQNAPPELRAYVQQFCSTE